jgi:arginyl-tRNA synthetase
MIRKTLGGWIAKALEQARASGELQWETLPAFEVEAPRQQAFGDYATNVAMLLAKQARTNPRTVAELIVRHLPLEAGMWIEKTEIAGAGFINFYLKPGWVGMVVRHILEQDEHYGEQDLGNGTRILIEFVSANPTGPLSVGHGRNAVLGDVLARILIANGYEVHREFYINDGEDSTQIRNFVNSVIVQFRRLLGEEIALPEEAYQGEYVREIAQSLIEQHGAQAIEGDPEEVYRRFEEWATTVMVQEQGQDLRDFGITFDQWFSERSLHRAGLVSHALERLKKVGSTYEHEGALWLRSTAYGDDKDRVLVRANGLPTYLAADVAYHLNKYERGFQTLINVLGADHHGYVARMKAMVSALGFDPDTLVMLIYQLVHVYRGGELVRMSKRTGDMVTLRDLMEEVGVDATRFFLLRSHDSTLDFDLDLAKEQSDKNPVYYVQYAHARICRIFEKAMEQGVSMPNPDVVDLSLLTHETEESLIKRLADLPDEVALAGAQYAPHRLTNYVLDVARAFHSFYTECRVLGIEPELSHARLMLCHAARLIIRNTLALIGLSAPESMERQEEA